MNNLDKEILDFMILRFINNRNYYERCTSGSWSDEEDEREKKLQSDKNNIQTSRTLAPSSIDKIINRYVYNKILQLTCNLYFLLLFNVQITSTDS